MIGVFDSGVGGLTVFRELKNKLPNTSIAYFADTLHLPYGERTAEEIIKFTTDITTFLLSKNIEALVIACNTASAIASETAKNIAHNITVYDVITPTVQKATLTTKNNKVGIIGTRATIASNVYARLIDQNSNGSITVIQKATPTLVPMIEKGILEGVFDTAIITEAVLSPEFTDIDTLILGCTHYPLIKNEIQEVFKSIGKNIQIVDSSEALCENIITSLKDTPHEKDPKHVFFTSKISPELEEFTALFLNEPATYTEVVV